MGVGRVQTNKHKSGRVTLFCGNFWDSMGSTFGTSLTHGLLLARLSFRSRSRSRFLRIGSVLLYTCAVLVVHSCPGFASKWDRTMRSWSPLTLKGTRGCENRGSRFAQLVCPSPVLGTGNQSALVKSQRASTDPHDATCSESLCPAIGDVQTPLLLLSGGLD